MPKIQRKEQKIFSNDSMTSDVAQFGSLRAGTPTFSKDPDVIQALSNFEEGWPGAVMGDNSPAMEDMNALQYLFSRQIAYLLQQGIPEWLATTTYYQNSFVGFNGQVYRSLVDDNLNVSPDSDPTKWCLFGVRRTNGSFDSPVSTGSALPKVSTVDNDTYVETPVPLWDVGTAIGAYSFTGVCYAPELKRFVAVGFQGSTGYIMYSSDGETWTDSGYSEDSSWSCVAWSPELHLFVAMASAAGTPGQRAATSPDGINWTTRTPSDKAFLSVCWSPQLRLFVAVAFGGTNPIETSPNGINWTARSITSESFFDVAWSPELHLFVALGNNIGTGFCYTSPDGINWTSRTIPAEPYRSVAWSKQLGLFVAVGGLNDSSDGCAATSPDGINWTARTPAATDKIWACVEWSNDLKCFVSLSRSLSQDAVVMYSEDGINWESDVLPSGLPSQTFTSLVWSADVGRFVAVGGAGAVVFRETLGIDSIPNGDFSGQRYSLIGSAGYLAPVLKTEDNVLVQDKKYISKNRRVELLWDSDRELWVG